MPLSNENFSENFRRGLDLFLDLFNRAHFFDAHEVLEDLWRSLPRDRPARRHHRLHVQGMIQLAVAFHHQSTGNHTGALSVLKRAVRNLNGAERSFPDLDFGRLRAELGDWEKHLAGAGPRPQPPHVFKLKATP
jgi:predicted metal-dependent hydrolase